MTVECWVEWRNVHCQKWFVYNYQFQSVEKLIRDFSQFMYILVCDNFPFKSHRTRGQRTLLIFWYLAWNPNKLANFPNFFFVSGFGSHAITTGTIQLEIVETTWKMLCILQKQNRTIVWILTFSEFAFCSEICILHFRWNGPFVLIVFIAVALPFHIATAIGQTTKHKKCSCERCGMLHA